jgi:hypothetical protein
LVLFTRKALSVGLTEDKINYAHNAQDIEYGFCGPYKLPEL